MEQDGMDEKEIIDNTNDKLNDLQMQINTLKMDNERINCVLNIMHKRITKMQKVKKE